MARYPTFSSVARRVLFGTAMLLTVGQAAMAETVELMCPEHAINEPDAAHHLSIDLGGSTVTVWETCAIYCNADKSVFQAQVNDQQVTWDDNVSSVNATSRWVLDRSTGTLIQFWPGKYGNAPTTRETCAKASKVF